MYWGLCQKPCEEHMSKLGKKNQLENENTRIITF